MNREEKQRQEERAHVVAFFRHYFAVVPVFEDLPTNSRPDVCVQFDGKRIGIELTRAVDSEQAVFDTYKEALLSGARRRFAQLSTKRGMVNVSLLPFYDTKAAKAHDLGVQLANDVASIWEAQEGDTVIQRHQLSPSLQRVVREVRMWTGEAAVGLAWASPTAAWVQGITNERLQPIIDSKADSLPEYRKMGCDEYWLLIYARIGKAGEVFDEAHGFDRATLVSPFDRTFFYDGWRSLSLCDRSRASWPA